jgi:hypothetical protein
MGWDITIVLRVPFLGRRFFPPTAYHIPTLLGN